MRITQLTFVGFYLNGALGSGNYDDITIDQVKASIREGTVFEFLANRLEDDIDLSMLTPDDRGELIAEWKGMENAVDEDRKMAVVKNGLCLLVAYLLEGIQRRASE